jgi:hypothetical protein
MTAAGLRSAVFLVLAVALWLAAVWWGSTLVTPGEQPVVIQCPLRAERWSNAYTPDC